MSEVSELHDRQRRAKVDKIRSHVIDVRLSMEDRARILEDRVEDLTREIVRTINEADGVPGRPSLPAELKDFAISLLREIAVSSDGASEAMGGVATQFNPLAMGIPLIFAGSVLIFLFPPVGVLLFVGAAVMIGWGLVVSIVARR